MYNITKTRKSIFNICFGAAVAALYVVLTYCSALFGLSSGVIQCRISEALCVLPFFSFYAVPGLTVGCLLANLLLALPVYDCVFGTLATFLGALGAYFLRRLCVKHKKLRFLLPIPTVIANTAIIPFVLKYAYNYEGSLLFFFATVGAGEIISAQILGVLLIYALTQRKSIMFDNIQ